MQNKVILTEELLDILFMISGFEKRNRAYLFLLDRYGPGSVYDEFDKEEWCTSYEKRTGIK